MRACFSRVTGMGSQSLFSWTITSIDSTIKIIKQHKACKAAEA